MTVLPARKPGVAGAPNPTTSPGSAYGPADLQSAYELAAASHRTGRSETVAAQLKSAMRKYGVTSRTALAVSLTQEGVQLRGHSLTRLRNR